MYASAFLTKSQIEAAYALIAAFAPDIPSGAWRTFCAGALEESGRGPRIVAVADPAGHLRGLAVTQADGGDGTSLVVPVFAPLSAADVPGVARALLGFLLAEARIRGCAEIRVGPLQPDSWKSYVADGLPRPPGTIIRVPA